MNIASREELLPLTPSTVYILTALSSRPMYGNEIITATYHDSGGIVEMASGTLYPALKRLVVMGMIEGVANKGRLASYKLTGWGRQVLRLELERMERITHVARTRLS